MKNATCSCKWKSMWGNEKMRNDKWEMKNWNENEHVHENENGNDNKHEK